MSQLNQDVLYQPNILARAHYDYSQDELKILVYIIRSFQPELKEQIFNKKVIDLFGNYRYEKVKISEIDPDNNYSRMKKAFAGANDKKFKVEKDDYESHPRLIEMPKYYAGEGVVSFTLNADLVPYFKDIAIGWHKFDVTTLFQLYPTAARFYMLMCERSNKGIVLIGAKELRAMLGLENKYSRFQHFKTRIIDQAQKEINALFDIKESKLKFFFDSQSSKPKVKNDPWNRTLIFKVVSYDNHKRHSGENAHNYYYDQFNICRDILARIYANNESLLKEYVNFIGKLLPEQIELVSHRLSRMQKEAAIGKTTLWNNPKYQKITAKILQEDFGYVKVMNREGFDIEKYYKIKGVELPDTVKKIGDVISRRPQVNP